MTQYETIKKVRNCLKLNGGLTVQQISHVTRIESGSVSYALKIMGDAYIDRWDRDNKIYELAEIPPHTPKPTKKEPK